MLAELWKPSQILECGAKSRYTNEKKIGINRAEVTLIWYKHKVHLRNAWRFLSVANNIFILLYHVEEKQKKAFLALGGC